MPKTDPSPRQQQIVEAIAEHGTVAAAAAALGLSVLSIDRALSGYHQRVCGRRIGDLEAEVARQRDKVAMDRAARRLEGVVGRIERAVTRVSHRRLADGGTRVKAQLREGRGPDPDPAPRARGLGENG